VQQPPVVPQEPPQEPTQEPPEEPQAFQKGGKVGNMKDAAESLLRVLHGSPTKVRLDKEKNLDVTTDESYAMKRARDKMDMFGQSGPPMLNKFDVPAAKMLRFEETYSPADVALMRRFFNRLPEGKAMTGEEIYDTAGGKDFVMEGIAKAGGMAGYERPAGGSGGVGNWYRVTDQEALTRKARGGLMHYGDGGKVSKQDREEGKEQLRLIEEEPIARFTRTANRIHANGRDIDSATLGVGKGNVDVGMQMANIKLNEALNTVKAGIENYRGRAGETDVNVNVSKPQGTPPGVYMGNASLSHEVGPGRVNVGASGYRTPERSGLSGYNIGYSGKVGEGRLNANVMQPKESRQGRSYQVQYDLPFAAGGLAHLQKRYR